MKIRFEVLPTPQVHSFFSGSVYTTLVMNTKAIVLGLALTLVAPLSALADSTTTPPSHPQLTQSQRQAMHQAFASFREKSMALHQQTRTQILGALTPAHRTLLASLVAQLAVANDPNRKQAAEQLDSQLSASEKSAILDAQKNLHTQVIALHEQMRAKMKSEMPSWSATGHSGPMMGHQGPMGDAGSMGMMHHPDKDGSMHHTPDAGMILLMTAMAPHR
ncbi:MAG: hypothetical protein ACYDGM_07255 [Vulcanimicrobiaceae bacterium]